MSEDTESLDLWKIPYHEPPPGVRSDFGVRSDLLDPTIVIVSLVLFTTTCIIALRIWANWGRGEWKMDDWCAIATFILTITNGGMLIPLTRVFGKQDYDIPVGLLRYSRWFQRMLSIYGFVLSFAILLGKCCMLALYYRLFSIRKSMRIQIYIALIFCLPIAAGGIAFIVEFGPEKSYEDMRRRREKREWVPVISSAACLVVDAMIVVMPIPVILGLNLSTRRKRGVLAMFATGSIAVVADIVVIYLRVLVLQRNGLGRHFIMTALFGIVECAISILVSSMPCVAQLYNRAIKNSALFIAVCTKLRTAHSRSTEAPSEPLDLTETKAKVEMRKKEKIRGPFSLPSLFRSGFSGGTRTDISTQKSGQAGLETWRWDLERRVDGDGRFDVRLNDLSNLTGRSEAA